MTLIAQLDLEQDPPSVHTVYYLAEDQPVPESMIRSEYIDVTDLDPPVQVGSTFDGETWGHPPPPPDMQAWTIVEIDANNKFLDDFVSGGRFSIPELTEQIANLTRQVNELLSRYRDQLTPIMTPPPPYGGLVNNETEH